MFLFDQFLVCSQPSIIAAGPSPMGMPCLPYSGSDILLYTAFLQMPSSPWSYLLLQGMMLDIPTGTFFTSSGSNPFEWTPYPGPWHSAEPCLHRSYHTQALRAHTALLICIDALIPFESQSSIRFSTSGLQDFLKHAIPDYLVRGTQLLECEIKK